MQLRGAVIPSSVAQIAVSSNVTVPTITVAEKHTKATAAAIPDLPGILSSTCLNSA